VLCGFGTLFGIWGCTYVKIIDTKYVMDGEKYCDAHHIFAGAFELVEFARCKVNFDVS